MNLLRPRLGVNESTSLTLHHRVSPLGIRTPKSKPGFDWHPQVVVREKKFAAFLQSRVQLINSTSVGNKPKDGMKVA